MNQRIEQLEIKIAYLEQANAQISDEMFVQRQQIEALRMQLAALTGRLDAAAQTPPTPYSAEEEKPPHY